MPVLTPKRSYVSVLAAFLLILCLASPVLAVVKYSEGSPEFTAAVAGTNEFSPGQETTLQILVKNNGLNLFVQTEGVGTMAQEDLPNTAKFVTVSLASKTPSVIVKSDPRYVGDIRGNGGSATAAFTIKITSDAAEPEYTLPVTISYQQPVDHGIPASDTYEYVYEKNEVTIPVTIRIKPEVSLTMLETDAGNVTVGAESIVRLRIVNTGSGTGRDAILKITRNGKSPVVPVDNAIYLKDFESGEILEPRFRISVSDDAAAQTYPVDIAIAYTDHEGSKVTTDPVTVGIDVLAKPEFVIVSSPAKVAAGSTATITVQYRNTGTATVYAASAGITGHAPVTFADDMAYLGDVKPGEAVSAVFSVQADSSAEPGEYSFDSRVRYRDASSTSIQSDTNDVVIEILPAETGLVNSPVLPVIGIAVLAGVVLLAYRYRMGRQ